MINSTTAKLYRFRDSTVANGREGNKKMLSIEPNSSDRTPPYYS